MRLLCVFRRFKAILYQIDKLFEKTLFDDFRHILRSLGACYIFISVFGSEMYTFWVYLDNVCMILGIFISPLLEM